MTLRKSLTLLLLLALTACSSPVAAPTTTQPEATTVPVESTIAPSEVPAAAENVLPSPTSVPEVPVTEVSVQDLPELQRVQMIGDGRIQHAAISPRGGMILITSPRGVELYATDVNIIWRALKDETAQAVSFDPTGQTLLVTLDDRSVLLYGRTGEVLVEIPEPILNPSWSPDGTQFVATTGDCPAIQVRDAATGAIIQELAAANCEELASNVQAVWASNDRIYLRDGAGFRVWNGADYAEEEPVSFEDGNQLGKTLSLSPDGLKLAIYDDLKGTLGLHIWDIRTGALTALSADGLPEIIVYSVAWRSDSKALAAQNSDSALGTWIWDLNGWAPAAKFPQWLRLTGYTPGGAYLYGVDGMTGIMTRLNWESGEAEQIMGSMIGFEDHLTWDEGGLLGTYKGSLFGLNVEPGTFTLKQQVCDGCKVQSWAGSDSAVLVLGDELGARWLQVGDQREDLASPIVRWSADGTKFENAMTFYNVTDPANITKTNWFTGEPDTAFAWSPDGGKVVIGRNGAPGTVEWQIADTATGEQVLPLPFAVQGDAATVDSAAWSADGKLIAGSANVFKSQEGNSRDMLALWGGQSGELLKMVSLSGEGQLHGLAFSPDGKWLAAFNPDGEIVVFYAQDLTPRYRSVTRLHWEAVIAWNPDSSSFAVTSEEVVRIYAVPRQ